jgi:hypothetical protein
MSCVEPLVRERDVNPPALPDLPIPPLPTFALTTLLVDLRRHTEFDVTTLTYHAEQSDATAADGYWHASINEARSFLEALMADIVRTHNTSAAPRPSASSNTPFSNWRRYLVEVGFLDLRESDLLHFVYGLSSAKGSHHGVPDEDWSRLARRMVFCTADYVLRRYATCKQHAPQPAVPAPRQTSPPRSKPGGTRRRFLRRLRKWLRRRRRAR